MKDLEEADHMQEVKHELRLRINDENTEGFVIQQREEQNRSKLRSMLVDPISTKQKIENCIIECTKIDADHIWFEIKYSGHGCRNGHWALGNGLDEKLSITYLLQFITDNTQEFKRVTIYIESDSCYSGKLVLDA